MIMYVMNESTKLFTIYFSNSYYTTLEIIIIRYVEQLLIINQLSNN